MPSLTLPDRMIWFAHCPKAGGTTVENLMVETWGDQVGHLHWGWDLWWRDGGWRQADPPNSPQHLTWRDAEPMLTAPPDAAFALVREPVARLTSEHRYQRKLRRGTRLGRALARLPFPIWLRLMMAVLARYPFAFDNHLRLQSDFVPEGATVFRLEDGMDAPIVWLAEVTNTALPRPPHHLATDRTSAFTVAEQDRALIAEVYAEDFHRFGYPIPDSYRGRPPPSFGPIALFAPLVVWLDRRGLL